MKFRDLVSDHQVCIVGLGYVGLTLAVSMADAGFDVIGVEKREDVVEDLKKGKPHFYEPGLPDRLIRTVRSSALVVTNKIPANCRATVYIITVGTPLDSSGRARMDMVENVATEVARNMKDGDLIIMRSTVKVGTTRKVVIPILEASGKKFDIAFCPERTLEGQALPEIRTLPQIVGGNSELAGVRAAQFFQMITPTVVRVSDLETAEMIKIVDNSSRDVGFAFANEVAQMCDLTGISAAEVIRAGKMGYARTNLPMPGPVGGPCLSKDSYILAESFEKQGYVPTITMAARQLNENQIPSFLRAAFERLQKSGMTKIDPKISILGLAFKGKPQTDDLRGTMAKPAIDFCRSFYPAGKIIGYDPVVPADMIRTLEIEPAESLEAAFRGVDLAIILNNHPIFSNMDTSSLASLLNRPGCIVDFWNHFSSDDLDLPEGVGFVALGGMGRAVWPELNA